jgi:hypothetical protein
MPCASRTLRRPLGNLPRPGSPKFETPGRLYAGLELGALRRQPDVLARPRLSTVQTRPRQRQPTIALSAAAELPYVNLADALALGLVMQTATLTGTRGRAQGGYVSPPVLPR